MHKIINNMENKIKLGVRKGAWTKEEDTLLRNCIHKFGEGKWHKVPHRAGLNRCRKSCRLRWLNYLRPNLKRGYFTKDEVDLILRLHKLLGNRWSIIAGRVPGRTANDVKNFWNTHILKKTPSLSARKITEKTEDTKTKKNITIKPRPRNFSKSQVPIWAEVNETRNVEHDVNNKESSVEIPNHVSSFSLSEEEVDECIRCWLETSAGDGDEPSPASFSEFSPRLINQKIAEFSSLAVDAHVWDLAMFD